MKKPDTSLGKLFHYRGKLAKEPTAAEINFFYRLTGRRIKFRFQHVIPPYIVDFVIPNKMLIIELDGKHHESGAQLEYDKRRTRYLQARGFTVVRIPNSDAGNWPLKNLQKFPKCKGVFNATCAKLIGKWETEGMSPPPARIAMSGYGQIGTPNRKPRKTKQGKRKRTPPFIKLFPCQVCGRELITNKKGRIVRHRVNGVICAGAFKTVK